MRNPYENNKCWPLRICEEDTDSGSRLGGLPPESVILENRTGNTRYFLTIAPPNEYVQLSIFTDFNFSDMFDGAGVLHDHNSTLARVVIHEPRARSSSMDLASNLSAHALQIKHLTTDWDLVEGEYFPYLHNKIGGIPAIDDDSDLFISVRKILADNFRLILQFGFPDSNDAPVSGNWPFAAGTFYLFAKGDLAKNDIVYCWEY